MLPKLRIVNSGNGNGSESIFFVRDTDTVYILNNTENEICKSSLKLSADESIRSVVADGKNICVGILDKSNTKFFQRKKLYLLI